MSNNYEDYGYEDIYDDDDKGSVIRKRILILVLIIIAILLVIYSKSLKARFFFSSVPTKHLSKIVSNIMQYKSNFLLLVLKPFNIFYTLPLL